MFLKFDDVLVRGETHLRPDLRPRRPQAVLSSILLTHRPNLRFAFDVGFVSRQFGQQRQYVLTTGILNDFH